MFQNQPKLFYSSLEYKSFFPLFFQSQIGPLLLVYSIVGALLCMLELLGVVLACALAHVLRRLARQKVMEEARMRQITASQGDTSVAAGSSGQPGYTDTSL